MPSRNQHYDDAQRNADQVADRFPVEIGDWTPVPRALYVHGDALGLTGVERAIVAVLLMHYRDPESEVFPGMQSLADRSGFSLATVRRALQRLDAKGLIPRERRTGKRGQATWRYDLRPLLDALADHRSEGEVVTETTAQSERRSDADHRSSEDRPPLTVTTTTAQSERGERVKEGELKREKKSSFSKLRSGRVGPNGRPLDNWGREVADYAAVQARNAAEPSKRAKTKNPCPPNCEEGLLGPEFEVACPECYPAPGTRREPVR